METVNSLYIHFPFCKSYCNYCDFFSRILVLDSDLSDFNRALERNYRAHEELFLKHELELASLDTLYIGGGTPSLWRDQGDRFLDRFLRKFELRKDAEFTVELNPGSANKDIIDMWTSFGANRFSVGIQTLSDVHLKGLSRSHNSDEAITLMEELSKQNLNFSVDLMLGLPSHLGKRDLEFELDTLLQYKPKHLSAYILTPKDDYIDLDKLPSEEQIEEEYLFVSDYLKRRDFSHYEVSSFAQNGFRSRHNTKYWLLESVAAIGPSATGFINLDSSTAVRYRWGEEFLLESEPEIELLTENELRLEKFYLRLRTDFGIRLEDFYSGKELSSVIELVSTWDDLGLVATRSPLRLSSRGYLVMDSLLEQLFNLVY